MTAEPFLIAEKRWSRLLSEIEAHWGEGVLVPINAPSRRDDAAFVRWFGRLERAAASPGDILALLRANYGIDVRHVLPAIQAPTLILHRVGDRTVPVAAGRYLAEQIHGARYVELPGDDHLLQAFEREVLDQLIDEVEEWTTGVRHGPEPDRVLVTVSFTDIVRSTEHLVALGDSRWKEVLDAYVRVVRQHLELYEGREIDVVGDGLFAAFDGPARAIRCAAAIRDAVQELGLEVRTGLHTGECEVVASRVSGVAVHTGSRVAALAGPQEILVSGTVRDLVAGSGIRFEDRGRHALRGLPGEWHLHAVTSAQLDRSLKTDPRAQAQRQFPERSSPPPRQRDAANSLAVPPAESAASSRSSATT